LHGVQINTMLLGGAFRFSQSGTNLPSCFIRCHVTGVSAFSHIQNTVYRAVTDCQLASYAFTARWRVSRTASNMMFQDFFQRTGKERCTNFRVNVWIWVNYTVRVKQYFSVLRDCPIDWD
jgi:hypothetical protein